MSAGPMHVDEIETNAALVRRLLAEQFPQWAKRTITPVRSGGTDHALYRLGDDMVVRLPRAPWAVGQIEKEHQWLPRLAPFLPLTISQPIAKGLPGEGFPCCWSVYRWLDGEDAANRHVSDPRQAAIDLANFIAALQQIDATGGPAPGPHNFSRGAPLAMRDAHTRAAITALKDTIDANAVTAVWDAALAAAAWNGPPVWIHGDLQAGNLLVVHGRLSAVIDFGGLGVGDPACDVMTAWLFLSAEARNVFRAALAVDDATWTRARGWALSVGLIALPYYENTNPALARIARRAIDEALAGRGSTR